MRHYNLHQPINFVLYTHIVNARFIYDNNEIYLYTFRSENFLRNDSLTFIHLDQSFYNNRLSQAVSRVSASFDSKDHPQNHTSHNI